MAEVFIRKPDGKVFGPVQTTQLKGMIAAKSLTHEDALSKSKDGPWTLAANVKGLFPREESIQTRQATPANEEQAPAPKSQTESSRSCPFCAEPIAAAAIKCKHCGEFLSDQIDRTDRDQTPTKIAIQQNAANIRSLQAPYEQVFRIAKEALLANGAELKDESLNEGYLLGRWRNGLNSLNVSIELTSGTAGWIQVKAKGFYADSFDTFGKAASKASEILEAVQNLAGSEYRDKSAGTITGPIGSPTKRNASNKLAAMSLTIGILGLFLFGVILGPIAILLGIIAFTQGTVDSGKAVAGIILGIVDLALFFVLVNLLMSVL